MGKLTRATLAEQAYAELQDQIVSGRLPAGRRLFADRIAGELAISQTPVKEALALLERDGLVQGTTRKASAVRRFSREDIIEIYEARLLLETNAIAVGRKAKRITPTFLEELRRTHESQKRHAIRAMSRNADDLAEALRFDREFHECIMRLTRNSLMIAWHRTILRQTQTIRTHTLETYNTPRSWQDHGAILEALAAGEFVEATRVLRDHLNGSRDQLASRPQEDLPEIT
jgi:DNA-binding GntR family transcriptional regulator